MAISKLTDGTVEALTKAAGDYYVWDSELKRFGVRVTPGGARVYMIQYRAKAAPGQAAKTRKIAIGQHDGKLWNVTKARAVARKLLAPVDLGRDPYAEREAERLAAVAAVEAAAAAERAKAEEEARQAREAEARARDSFEKVAERFFDLCLKETRSGHEVARLLRHGPIAAWSGRHIAEIRRADVGDLIDRTRQRSPAVARQTYAALRGLFGWCLDRDLIDASPCDRVKAPPRPEARDRVLSDCELRAVWNGADGLGYPFGPILKLLILTGQRRAEVAGMQWAEVDLEAATWRIPKERSKNGKAHEVDLSPQAVEVLRPLKRLGRLVFPARNAPARKHLEGEKPALMAVRGFSATKRTLDANIEAARLKADPRPEPVAAWRIHDLRRTAATGMAAMNFAPHIVERVLNHISGTQSGLVGVYQRHDYRAERKAAMTAWGARVEAIITGKPQASNVTQLRA